MEIHKLLTPFNHTSSTIDRIKYIVIHYVGATGGAEANCKWYAGADRGASAHYYVDFDGTVWQSVEDKNVAWHCGTKNGYKHPDCRNSNSIGIEMCVRNKGNKADTSRDWYFEDITVKTAIALTKELMRKYNIPADHVIRHYDVTGKICPNPYVYNHTKHTWDLFKAALVTNSQECGWIEDKNGWYYLHPNGNYTKSGWELINSKWYWFNEDGYAYKKQWLYYKDKWYYLDESCAMVVGFKIIDGKPYYFSNDGSIITSLINIAFLPDENGVLQPQ